MKNRFPIGMLLAFMISFMLTLYVCFAVEITYEGIVVKEGYSFSKEVK
jgi:hypothetical protein